MLNDNSIKNILTLTLLTIAGFPAFSQLSPLNLGTLHPGDSIVIYYDATINAGAGTQVSNQGTITGTGINVLTDDPDTDAADDATITLLNMFPLPVRLLEVKATARNGAVEVSWRTTNEEDMIRYEVEKSTDGRAFVTIGEVTPRHSASETTYAFLDQQPAKGANYYRLRLVDHLGVKYSAIVRVTLEGGPGGIQIYPNPVTQQAITLQLGNLPRGTYDLVLYNSVGQIAWRERIAHEGGSATHNIALPQGLLKGVYSVQVRSSKKVHSQLLIVH